LMDNFTNGAEFMKSEDNASEQIGNFENDADDLDDDDDDDMEEV